MGSDNFIPFFRVCVLSLDYITDHNDNDKNNPQKCSPYSILHTPYSIP